MRKLTLSMEDSVIRDAKRLAKKEGTSLSALFSRIVRAMARTKSAGPEISPNVKRISGIITLPKGKTERQVLEEALEERYGLKR